MTLSLSPLFRLAAGLNRHLPVLQYHQVLAEPDPMRPDSPDAKAFAEQLDWLAAAYRILPLDQAVDALLAGRLPARALAISFDDGYRDNLEVAAPVLAAKGLHATFFLTTAWLEGGLMFNDRIIEAVRRWPGPVLDGRPHGLERYALGSDRERLDASEAIITAWKHRPHDEREARVASLTGEVAGMPSRLMLSAPEVRRLHGLGFGLGGHSHEHPILTRVPPEAARAGIVRNKAELEALTGERLRLFAYPNGKPGQDYGAEHVAMVREAGYDYGFSTALGAAGRDADPYQLPRFRPWDKRRTRFLAHCLRYGLEGGYDRV